MDIIIAATIYLVLFCVIFGLYSHYYKKSKKNPKKGKKVVMANDFQQRMF